jgi:hypothetical protein
MDAVRYKPAHQERGYRQGRLIKARNGQSTDLYDANGYPIWGFDSQGRPVCNARKNSKGDLDMSVIRCSNGRCRKHGGTAMGGALHGNAQPGLKHSKLIRNLPAKLKESVSAFLGSSDLLNLDYQIALGLGRLEQLQDGLVFENADAAIAEMREAYEAYLAVIDTDAGKAALDNLGALIIHGSTDQKQWRLIRENNEHLRKLVDTEIRRRAQHEQMIPIAVLRDYTARIIDIHVTALVKHLRIMADRTTDAIRDALLSAGLVPDTVASVMPLILPIVQGNFKTAERRIRNESGQGVEGLWGLPSRPMIEADYAEGNRKAIDVTPGD